MKTQSTKRILCIITILLMLCASLPFTAEAAKLPDVNVNGGTQNIVAGEYTNINIAKAEITIDPGQVVKVLDNFVINPGSVVHVNGTLDLSNCCEIVNNAQIIIGCSGELICDRWVKGVSKPGHSYENGVCTVCGVKGCEIGELDHSYEKGVCTVCGVKGCEIGELDHSYENGICTVCNHECDNSFHEGECPECGMKSAVGVGTLLSGGSITIVVIMACLAVGFICGLLVNRKKKSA